MDGGSACVQRPYDWLEITSMEAFQKPHFVTFWTRRTSLNFYREYRMNMYIQACTFSEVRRPLNSQIHGKLSVCSWSTAAVGAIFRFNVNVYLWISLLHCLLFQYSCLFWLGVGQIRRISGSPTWTWTVSSMRKIHRNIEDKSWFLLENDNARLCHLVAWTRFRPCSDGVAMW